MLKRLRQFAKENFVPIVREKTAELLVEKIKEVNPKNILEIGTAIGYSGILMLNNCNANLITLEKNEEMLNLATLNFKEAGVNNRVEVVLGDCKNYIENTTNKFDFIFLDGPKSHYLEYLPYLLNMLTNNGIIFADNVLFQGLVKGEGEIPKKFKTIVTKLREFLNVLENDENLLTEIIDLEDGVAIIKKRN